MKVNVQFFPNFCATNVPLLRRLWKYSGELLVATWRRLGEHLVVAPNKPYGV